MPLSDLRDYIDALREIGELQEISAPVSLDLELEAIVRRCYELGAPAPLFRSLIDHRGGFRVLGAPAGLSRRSGQDFARVATSLELPHQAGGLDIVAAIAGSLARPSVAPVHVDLAPCFQNTMTGDAVDLDRLPVPPSSRPSDGRLLSAWGCLVARTPEGRWTHWAIARVRRLDARRMIASVWPRQHVDTIARAWAATGRPMPFALALGVEPAIPFVCGLPSPARTDGSGRLGALLGRPAKLVRCRSIDLDAPASAEVLIEGHLRLPDRPIDQLNRAGTDEGWQGLASEGPVYHVSAVSHRDGAIIPVVAAGEPIEESHTTWGLSTSAQLLHELRGAGIPAAHVWIPLRSAMQWLVVTVPRDWRRRTGIDETRCLCRRIGELVFGSQAGLVIPKVIVLNDDVDPSDTDELVWALATRCHPFDGHVVFEHLPTPAVQAPRQAGRRPTFATGRIVYNGLPPDEWGEATPIRSSFRYAYPPDIVARVRRRWAEYGFRQDWREP